MEYKMTQNGVGNALPSIEITINRYELGELVRDHKLGKVQSWKLDKSEKKTKLPYELGPLTISQEVKIIVK